MLNPMAFQQTLHMTLAAYTATGFAVAGIHALLLLFDPHNAFHRRALSIALMVGAPAALLQPISGDISARSGRPRTSRPSSRPWRRTSRPCRGRR